MTEKSTGPLTLPPKETGTEKKTIVERYGEYHGWKGKTLGEFTDYLRESMGNNEVGEYPEGGSGSSLLPVNFKAFDNGNYVVARIDEEQLADYRNVDIQLQYFYIQYRLHLGNRVLVFDVPKTELPPER